ncbi:hypothetical protein [Streptomyces marincola]|uniref:hypothetical protein n=1 Tax=Streptomyces marincola TaxID=2878388 RepID=UPI001CF25AE8|nr:hypothetical protein [Streptomyces marincola]UCM89249.1 hypothetical protein LC193_15560 [Streptomyces marincola]
MPEPRHALRALSGRTPVPHSHSRPLPPYRGIVAVDAKDFTGHRAIEHGAISRVIPQLLEISFERAGLADVWADRRFPNSTGDGYVFGFDPSAMPMLIHPWLLQLQDTLTEFNVHSTGTVRIRLRVSLNVGPLPDSGEESDGNGTPRNDTHRLLDSRPVKVMLASSSENTTQVVAVLSDRCYQDAVISGYTGRHEDYFIEVPATVEGKAFAQRAWLYVPALSGNLLDRRILGDRVLSEQERDRDAARKPASGAGSSAAPPQPSVVNRADQGFVNTGTVHGGQSLTNNMGPARPDSTHRDAEDGERP